MYEYTVIQRREYTLRDFIALLNKLASEGWRVSHTTHWHVQHDYEVILERLKDV